MIEQIEINDQTSYPGKLAVLQRVLPSYRVPFFDMLAEKCAGGLSLAAGEPRPDEAIDTTSGLKTAQFQPLMNIHLLKGKSYLCWQKGLLHWLQSFNPDSLVVEANPRYLSTRKAISWMKTMDKPVIGWGLGSAPTEGPLKSIRISLRKKFLHHFDALIAYSQQGLEQYRSLGFPAEKIFIAHNAVAPKPTQPPIIRSDTSQNQPGILFVGRLQERKRIDLLIRACSNLPQEIKPKLVIIGDGPEKRALQDLAEKIYPSALFTGALHGKELEPYFKAADIFVLPGTGGLAIQQAMGWSLPVITAEGDGTQQDLVRKENGWQVAPGDQKALELTLQEALSDVPRLRSMGLESYRIVSEEINLESMVSTFITALNKTS